MSARYYVAPDGYDNPTLWRDHGPDDTRPEALLTRTDANAELFDFVARSLGLDNPLAVGTFCPRCDTRLNVGDNTNPDRVAATCPMCGEAA